MASAQDTVVKSVGASVLFLLVIVGLGALGAFPVKWLVNYLFTPAFLTLVFGVSHIGVWQAWALSVLGNLLVKSNTSSK